MECRICFLDHQEEGNRLFSPCLCTGTQKFIHEQCLMRWMEYDEEVQTRCKTCLYEWEFADDDWLRSFFLDTGTAQLLTTIMLIIGFVVLSALVFKSRRSSSARTLLAILVGFAFLRYGRSRFLSMCCFAPELMIAQSFAGLGHAFEQYMDKLWRTWTPQRRIPIEISQ